MAKRKTRREHAEKGPVLPDPPEMSDEEEAELERLDYAAQPSRNALVDAINVQRGPATVEATCMHQSGHHGRYRTPDRWSDAAELVVDQGGELQGMWVSTGCEKYAEPVALQVHEPASGAKGGVPRGGRRQLTRTARGGTMAVPWHAGIKHVCAFYALDETVSLVKGESVSVCWRNETGKRCGHFVVCAMEGD